MTAFANRLRDPPLVVWTRRGLALFAVAFVLLGAVSSYRAWVQVYSLSLEAADSVVGPGASVQVRVKTSGRTFVQLQVELLQSGRAETLAVDEIPKNGDAAVDPRAQHRTLSIALAPELWSRFHAGPALLRATAIGRPQWLRTPPPTVRELTIALQ